MWVGWVILAALQSPGQPLTLDSALHQARIARGRVQSAAAGVAEARAQRRLLKDIPNPTVTFEHTGDTPHQHLTVDQDLSWLLTHGPNKAAGTAGIRRAEADSVGTIAELIQNVRIAFYDALASGESLRLVEEQAGFSDSLTRIARARLAAGDISQLEFEQAAQDGRRAQQLLSQTRENALADAAALGRAIGWSGASPPLPSGALDLGLDVDTTLTIPLDSVPAVRSAVADSVAAVFNLKSARLARIPLPSLTGGTEWGDPDRPGQQLSVLGLAIPVPIFGVGNAEVALAQARLDLAAAEARETRQEAGLGVAQARVHLLETARRARFARDSLIPGARQLRLRAVTAYRAGETGILPVLDALRSERDVVLEGVAALQAFQEALARWRALAGRTE